MAFRELATGAGCDESGQQNAINQFARKLDQNQRNLQEGWHFMGQQQQQRGGAGLSSGMLNNPDGLAAHPDPGINDFLRQFRQDEAQAQRNASSSSSSSWQPVGLSAPPAAAWQVPLPPSQAQALHDHLHHFLLSSLAHEPLVRQELGDVLLAVRDRSRLQDRLRVVAPHLFSGVPPPVVERQIDLLLARLDDAGSSQLPPGLPELASGGSSASAWADDLRRFEEAPPRPHPPPGARLAQLPFSNEWARDFETSPEARVQGAPADWANEFQSSWAERTHQPTTREQELEQEKVRAMTAQLQSLAVDDPSGKLRNSQFLAMMQGLSSGQLAFRDKQLLHQSNADARGVGQEGWANEFSRQEEAAGWARELQQQQQQQQQPSQQQMRWQTAPDSSQLAMDELGHAEADEWYRQFARDGAASATARRGEDWAAEMSHQHQQEQQQQQQQDTASQWADELSGNAGSSWAAQLNNSSSMPLAADSADSSSALDMNSMQYVFAPNNPYISHPDPYTLGLQLQHEGALADAILAFEAAVQQANPSAAEAAAPSEQSTVASAAWSALGQVHAENDKDERAIACLLRAVSMDGNNLEALLSLCVSCTNDFYRAEALNLLETWMENHPEYNQIMQMQRAEGVQVRADAASQWDELRGQHSRVADLFLRAARLRADNPDFQVQVALGILYNLSYEYDKAVDCFRSALSVKPGDYATWNKLGATLANSSRSEEAIDAYQHALALRPSYVRARANLGIAYLALHEHGLAAQQFLRALLLHRQSRHIWTNLEVALRLMGRPDLLELAANENPELFRNEFNF